MRRRDWWGLATVAAATALLILYRLYYLEPREWGAACAATAPPLACMPRAALIWLQGQYLLGSAALALGLAGFAWGGAFAAQLAAVVAGVAAIENYNATWGAIGLALGALGLAAQNGLAGASARLIGCRAMPLRLALQIGRPAGVVIAADDGLSDLVRPRAAGFVRVARLVLCVPPGSAPSIGSLPVVCLLSLMQPKRAMAPCAYINASCA